MKRRSFMRAGLLAGSSALATGSILTAHWKIHSKAENQTSGSFKFNIHYAPHDGMFVNHAGKDIIDQIRFMSDTGFTAFEDNGMMGRPVEMQEKIGNELNRLGMVMGVFVVDGGDNWKISLTTGKKEFLDTFLKTCRSAVEVAGRCNAKWMTVVPGYFERELEIGIQTSNVISALRKGAEIFEPRGLTMVLEPLSDNPDLFLRTSQQSFMVCKAVNSPACKILYDIYHMQRNEGNLIPHIDTAWDEIAYFQIGDNPGRKEPTTGEINYKNIFSHIYNKDYKGVFGMEHGISKPGKDGEIALIEAYKEVDKFK